MLRPTIRIRRGSPDFEVMKKRIAELETMFRKRMPKIAVGLPRDSLPYPDGTSVIMVGYWNEYGSEATGRGGGIVARPWLRTGAHENREAWVALAGRIIKSCVQKGTDPMNAFALLGLRMENDIKLSISEGAWEPNKGAYAEAKAAQGKTKPLILTGHMRQSVRYAIMQKEETT